MIAVFGGTAPLLAATFVGAGHPMYVANYMTVVVALCLIVYFTLPETGNRGERVTVASTDPEVLEGKHVVSRTVSAAGPAKPSGS